MTYVIGTAGHVDHGKSTLVRALTGIDPDRLEEEKRREMTIDLGFAWLTLPEGESVGIVDVPGHRDFIENMLAGVGGIDLALFVIAADEGVMPQTREHLAILDLLAVPGGVIALTKIDMVQDDDWLDLVMLDVAEVMDGTVLADAPIIPVSARTDDGLDDLLAALDEQLTGRPPRPDRGRPRLPVDRVFTMSGFGTVVTGTLTDGSLSVGDEVEIIPAGRRGRIRGLQSHKETVEQAGPGSRVAVNLTGIDRDEVKRGDVLAAPSLLRGTTLIDVQFQHMADLDRPLKHNSEVKFFSGAAETMAYVRLVGDRELSPGMTGWLQLRLTDPVALDKGDRFILRDPSPAQTIGGGHILDPHPPHRWRRYKPEVIERFETLAAGSPDELVLHVLEGQMAMTGEVLVDATGLSRDDVSDVLEQLETAGTIVRLEGSRVMAQAAWNRVQEQISRTLATFHHDYPLRIGIAREEMRSRLNTDGKLFGQIVMMAVDEGLLVDAGTVLHQPGHEVRFTDNQQIKIDQLWAAIEADPYNTPNVKEAAAMVGEDVLQALIDLGYLVQPSGDVIFATETYQNMVEAVITHIKKHGSIELGNARDMFSSSRKYMLALLESMDAAGITNRRDNARVLRRS